MNLKKIFVLLGLFVSMILTFSCKKNLDKSALPVDLKGAVDFSEPGETKFASTKYTRDCVPSTEGLSRSSCDDGEFCVADPKDEKLGTCLKECGEKIDGKLVKNQSKCEQPWRCITMRDSALSLVGNFCHKPQNLLEMPCASPFDEDACTGGMACLPTIKKKNSAGKTEHSRFRCKRECVNDKDCADENNQCLKPKFARTQPQMRAGTTKVENCSQTTCRNSPNDCRCNLGLGYSCTELVPNVDSGLCVRALGVCGRPVQLANINDFRGKNFFGETCNEMAGDKYCIDPLKSLSYTGAQTSCRPISRTGEGACISFCSMPSFDNNENGIIDPEEKGASVKCAPDYSCKTRVSRRLELNAYLRPDGKNKACDILKCKVGMPCPEECGPGDAECMIYRSDDKVEYICGAPAGVCELD